MDACLLRVDIAVAGLLSIAGAHPVPLFCKRPQVLTLGVKTEGCDVNLDQDSRIPSAYALPTASIDKPK
eukprot:765988-Hanusia_phi.AAC.1